MLTLSEIRDFTRNYLDIDSEDISDSVINQWVRQGFNKIVRERKDWKGYYTVASLSTVAAQESYQFPTELAEGEIKQIFGPSGPLRRWGESQAESRFGAGYSTDTGEPIAYTVYDNDTIRFWPTPGGVYTYTVEGYRQPTDPVTAGPSAVPDLPNDEAHDVLLDFVQAQANTQQDDFDKSNWFMSQFTAGLKQLAADDATASPYQPVIMNGNPSGSYGIPEMGRWPSSNFPA